MRKQAKGRDGIRAIDPVVLAYVKVYEGLLTFNVGLAGSDPSDEFLEGISHAQAALALSAIYLHDDEAAKSAFVAEMGTLAREVRVADRPELKASGHPRRQERIEAIDNGNVAAPPHGRG